MGGELFVESKPNLGSNFHFSLNFPIGTPKQCEKIKRINNKLRSLKCLLVDDNSNARKIIGDMMRAFGWVVLEASSGTKALNKILKSDLSHPFDIIYIDYRMPELDGWETCKRIRDLKINRSVKLIIMSQIYDSNHLEELQKDNLLKIDGYLLKPATSSSLFDSAANIYLPVSSTNEMDLESTSMARRLNGIRILLVEDNLTNQIVAHDLLVSEGADVSISGDSFNVLNEIEAADPLFDLVIMDIQMPGMDGYVLTKKIRTKYSMEILPIIAMSANTFEESRDKAIKVGMNDFVSKPFHLDELVAKILQYTKSIMITEGHQNFDEKDALNRFRGNKEIYARTLAAFIQDVKKLLNELPPLLPGDNDEQFNRTLHTLKGLASTVGANALFTIANDVYQQFKKGLLTNKEWHRFHRELNNISLEAILWAENILKKSPVKSNKLPLVVNKLHLFKKLIPYLETNNMKALGLYAELKQEIGTDEILDEAIESLNFKAAIARCQFLIKENNEGAS